MDRALYRKSGNFSYKCLDIPLGFALMGWITWACDVGEITMKEQKTPRKQRKCLREKNIAFLGTWFTSPTVIYPDHSQSSRDAIPHSCDQLEKSSPFEYPQAFFIKGQQQ
jgi:hypothetical protein